MSYWTGGSRLLVAAAGERHAACRLPRPCSSSPGSVSLFQSPPQSRLHNIAHWQTGLVPEQKKDTKLAMLVSIQYQVRTRNAGLVSQTLLFI